MRTNYGLSREQKERVWDLRLKGNTLAETARSMGVTTRRVKYYVHAVGGIKPERPRSRSRRALCLAEREEISRGIAAGHSCRRIGGDLGRHHTTISREIGRCGGRGRYRAHHADDRAWRAQLRPRPGKLDSNRELAALVAERLALEHSPEQISGWLRLRYPDNESMQISHETIYRSLYVQARGALKKELCRHLRSGRTARRAQGAGKSRGKIREMVPISERPAEAADRAVPGHWEGDLLKGGTDTAIATLVERQTRYCQLVALPDGFGAVQVREALAASIVTFPEQLRRSLTWDQGTEMAEHVRFSVETGLPVYFCDPRSPWQRGLNENTNGLLRQYFPKGQSLKGVDQARLDEVAARLNTRPRETLGFHTPAEKMAGLTGSGPDR
jgi:IS30 family transposase